MAHSATKTCKVGRRLCKRKERHSIWKGALPEKKRETFSSQKQKTEKIHRGNYCWVVAEFAGKEFKQRGFPRGSAEKERIHLPMQETWAQSLDWEDPLEKVNGNPLQYSCLEKPMDRGTWWATVHQVTKESE